MRRTEHFPLPTATGGRCTQRSIGSNLHTRACLRSALVAASHNSKAACNAGARSLPGIVRTPLSCQSHPPCGEPSDVLQQATPPTADKIASAFSACHAQKPVCKLSRWRINVVALGMACLACTQRKYNCKWEGSRTTIRNAKSKASFRSGPHKQAEVTQHNTKCSIS